MKKQLIAFVLSLMMLCSLILPAYATSINQRAIDDTLLSRGYPQVAIDSMSANTKLTIYNDPSLEFSEAYKVYVSFEDETVYTFPLTAEPTILPASISKSELELDMVFSKNIYSNGGTDYLRGVYVSVSYEWLTIPLQKWTDGIAISWAADYLTMRDDSFEGENWYRLGNLSPSCHSSNFYPNEIWENGLAWDAELFNLPTGYVVRELYGYGSFRLDTTYDVPSSSTKFYFKYAHATADVSITFDISKYGSISVSPPNHTDSASQSFTFRW